LSGSFGGKKEVKKHKRDKPEHFMGGRTGLGAILQNQLERVRTNDQSSPKEEEKTLRRRKGGEW